MIPNEILFLIIGKSLNNRSVNLVSKTFNLIFLELNDKYRNDLIHYMTKLNQTKRVIDLLKFQNSSLKESIALNEAVQSNNIILVSEFLKHPSVDPTKNDYEAVYVAVYCKHSHLLPLLCDWKPKRGFRHFYPNRPFFKYSKPPWDQFLWTSIRLGHDDCIKFFLQKLQPNISISTHRLIDVINKSFWSTFEILAPFCDSESIVSVISHLITTGQSIEKVVNIIEKTKSLEDLVFLPNDCISISHFLLKNQKADTLLYLLRFPLFDYTLDDQKLLRKSCQKGYEQYVRLLLTQPKTKVSVVNNFAHRKAFGRGFHDIALLLENQSTFVFY